MQTNTREKTNLQRYKGNADLMIVVWKGIPIIYLYYVEVIKNISFLSAYFIV